jgi:hypothetical protein
MRGSYGTGPAGERGRGGELSESDDRDAGADPQRFKDAMARWASTVTVVAVRGRDDRRIRATTVTSFAPVSAEPPEVVVSLNASAQVLPFLGLGDHFGISLLSRKEFPSFRTHLRGWLAPCGRSILLRVGAASSWRALTRCR